MDSNEAQCAYQQAQNPGRILGTAEGMSNACDEAPRSKTIRTQVEIPANRSFSTALEHLSAARRSRATAGTARACGWSCNARTATAR